MKILVTGGAGYLGSALVPKLLVRGHHVRILDVGFFGIDHLPAHHPRVEVIRDDIRQLAQAPDLLERALNDCDSVIHLAAISNDPSADLHPDLTSEINHSATTVLAEACKSRGIRFLFSSSCSVYGDSDGILDEESAVKPLTIYAESKLLAEADLAELSDASWRPVILQNGTLFGTSARMRFDLVVNIFSLFSSLRGEIRVFGTGTQWRPFLHLADCARAFVFLAEKPELEHLVYNVSHENLRVVDVAECFGRVCPGLKVVHTETTGDDHRNYRVSAERLSREGFATRISVEQGAEQMNEDILCGRIRNPESLYYRNAKWLQELATLGGRDPFQVIGLLETLVGLRLPPGPGR